MADFKTHIGTSTVVGIGYGVAGHFLLDAPIPTCVISGGLCSVAGMLPDLDSDSGVPVRETMSFAAAVIPMFLFDRFAQANLSHEAMVLTAGLIYVLIRFGVAELFKRYTVHRGMWHSIPACISAGLLTFLLVNADDMTIRLYKTFAVVLGFMVHLILDEIWSIEWRGLRLKVKKSFGTAIKLWSPKDTWANISTYAKLAILIAMVAAEQNFLPPRGKGRGGDPSLARQPVQRAIEFGEQVWR